MNRGFWIILASVWATSTWALSLDQAIEMAKNRNGTLKASALSVMEAQSDVRIARAGFLPTVTPSLRYDINRNVSYTGSTPNLYVQGFSSEISAAWRLLDNGTRKFGLQTREQLLDAQSADFLQTLRRTMFNVSQQYYETMRAQELVKVQRAQVERSDLILKQTQARVREGDVKAIETLQAEADLANSQVALLEAQARERTARTSLSAIIGWSAADGELTLDAIESEYEPIPPGSPMGQYLERGLKARPDLIAQRARQKSGQIQVRLARAGAGFDYRIEAQATRTFSANVGDRTSLALVASFPLFDGGISREEVKKAELSLAQSKALLEQSERDVLAEIQSAFEEAALNRERHLAARKALAAARKNFEAAKRGQALDVSDLVDVIQAQTSLVTAEVNFVQSLFDSLIASARLEFVSGGPVQGAN